MRYLLLSSLCFGLAALTVQESQGQQDSASALSNQSVGAQLRAFDAGTITFDELFQNPAQKWCEAVAAYYEAGTNEITTKMKLPIARCMIRMERYKDSAKLAGDYTKVYPRDVQGWTILGWSQSAMKDYKEAVESLTRAVKLGDDESYVALGANALGADRDGVLRDIVVPHLLALKDRSSIPKDKRLEMRTVLVACAAKLDKEDIFVSALRGAKAEEIVAYPDLAKIVKQCWEQFHSPESREIRRKIEQAAQSKGNQ